MGKYLLAYHGGAMPETEEEGVAVMTAWGVWMGAVADAMVDEGNPIGQAATINSDGSVSAGAGANPITGYSIISADSLDHAVSLTQGCPILAAGGTVQIAETYDVM